MHAPVAPRAQELKAYLVRQKEGPDFKRLECSAEAKERMVWECFHTPKWNIVEPYIGRVSCFSVCG